MSVTIATPAMASSPAIDALKAAILNAGVLVRLYRHGNDKRRVEALMLLGIAVRNALGECQPQDYAEVFDTILDALLPNRESRF